MPVHNNFTLSPVINKVKCAVKMSFADNALSQPDDELLSEHLKRRRGGLDIGALFHFAGGLFRAVNRNQIHSQENKERGDPYRQNVP